MNPDNENQAEGWSGLNNLNRMEQIFGACRLIADSAANDNDDLEDRLNRKNIRAIVGYSDRDIQPVINLFKRREAIRKKMPENTDIFMEVLVREVNKQFNRYRQEFEELAEQEQHAFAQTSQAFSDTIQEQDHEMVAIKQDMDALRNDIIELNTQLTAKTTLIDELRATAEENQAQLNLKLQENDQLRTANADYKQRLDAMQTAHETALATIKAETEAQQKVIDEKHVAETNRLNTLLGNERGEWHREKRDMERNRETQQQALIEAHQQLNANSLELAAISKAADTSTTRLETVTQQLAEKTCEVNEQKDIGRQLQHATATIDDLKQQNKELITNQKERTSIQQELKAMQANIAALQKQLTTTKRKKE